MSLQNFISEVKTAGLAKSNRYMVIIDLPRGLIANGQPSQLVGDIIQSTVGRSSIYTRFFPNQGNYLASLYCEATALPASNIDTKIHKVYGPGREMPYGRSYTPVGMTFYLDQNYAIKDFFERWQSIIYNEDTSHMNYYNEYVSNVHILAIDNREGRFGALETLGDLLVTARYQCTLQECYPKTIAEVTYGAGNNEVARLQVSFQYRKWKNTTNQIGGIVNDVMTNASLFYNPTNGVLSSDKTKAV